MLGWALLTLVFAVADNQLNGFHSGPFVTAILTNIYLAKFFHWETGYFNTLGGFPIEKLSYINDKNGRGKANNNISM